MNASTKIAAVVFALASASSFAAAPGTDVTGTYFEFTNAAATQTRAAVIADIRNATPRGEFQDPVRSTSGLTRIEVAAARNLNPGANSEWFDTSTISTVGGRTREEVRAEAIQYVQGGASKVR